MASSAKKTLKIALVAGESSGDILGADFIKAIVSKYPDYSFQFEGIAGERMQALGCHSLYPLERLSVMGLIEVLSRLPELLKARKNLAKHFIQNPPDLFIGIDAPDFTLGLEGMLKAAGITTVHYVSPSVWAWKPKRIYKIKKTTDLLLTLFPFEGKCYEPTSQRLVCVGHPLADLLPDTLDLPLVDRIRSTLVQGSKLVALLPGSRGSEIKYLSESFFETARWLQHRDPKIRFVLPVASRKIREKIETLQQTSFSDLNLQIIDGCSREAMAASDAILIASGTATLEATLLGKPMVVAYRMSPITFAIYSRMVTSKYISLPNLLAGEKLVPEILQDEVRPDVLGPLIEAALNDDERLDYLNTAYQKIHASLRLSASDRAADAVMSLIQENNARAKG